MAKEQKSMRDSLNSLDTVERHMAQDLAFAKAVEAMRKTRQAKLTAEDAQMLRDFERYANK